MQFCQKFHLRKQKEMTTDFLGIKLLNATTQPQEAPQNGSKKHRF